MIVEELLYGDSESCRACRPLKADKIVCVGARFGVVSRDLEKGEIGDVICCGPFVYVFVRVQRLRG